MKIGFFEIEGWEEQAIRERFAGQELTISPDKITPLALPAARDFDAISVFVNSELTEEVLTAFPNLKFVATRSTGYDHINCPTCQARGIIVSYVPGYGDNTVAEFAFGLLLNLTRKMYLGIDRLKEGGEFSFAGLRGMDLKGKTMGIVGTGRIGRETAAIAKGFGMTVVASDPYPNAEWAAKTGVAYLPLEGLLAQADVISIHCPCTKETHHLLNAENMKRVKRGAYLINTARGGIVETEALVAALKDGTLAGAGLDVLEEEGDVKDEVAFLAKGHPGIENLRVTLENLMLMKMPNVLITPHNAFNTQEALGRILMTTLDNMDAFIAGKPQNVVPES